MQTKIITVLLQINSGIVFAHQREMDTSRFEAVDLLGRRKPRLPIDVGHQISVAAVIRSPFAMIGSSYHINAFSWESHSIFTVRTPYMPE